GAIVLFGLASLIIALARLIEWAILKYFRTWQYSGRTGINLPGKTIFAVLAALSLLIIPLMGIWSVAQRWRFPDLLPSRYSMRFWEFEWD
ncbi:thiamine ABC transporter permease, partial [Vibrio splendidus]